MPHLIPRVSESPAMANGLMARNPTSHQSSKSLNPTVAMASTTVLDKRSALTQGLFVSITSPSKAAHLGLSPISTTTAKQTETPRKLKDQYDETKPSDEDNRDNNEQTEDEELQNQQDALTPLGLKRSDSWGSRAGFSPRPKRANNPTRRPVQSAASIQALRTKEEVGVQENADQELPELAMDEVKTAVKSGSFKLNNQSQHSALERIQESETSDDDDEDDQDAQYDGDGEDGEALQLYKSLSSDLSVRYDSRARKCGSHDAYDKEDDDIVRI